MHQFSTMLHQIPDAIPYVGTHNAEKGEDFPLHQDQYWELMYMRSGHITCQQGDKHYPLHPGAAILHPPRVPHADFATTAYTTYYIWIDAPAATPWPCLYYDDESGSLERLCRLIVKEWRGTQPQRPLMLALLAEQLAVLMQRAVDEAQQSSGDSVVLAAEQIMEERHREPLCVREIAHQVGVSVSSLYECFARHRGRTPMEALQALRLRHALALLHHSTLTLETVADLCGYHSASHLSRHVKAASGKSPGRLRHGRA